MIIDADCHIAPIPVGGNSITSEELLRRMDRAGVAQAVTWLQPPYNRDVDPSNLYVYESAKKHPDRILGFGWADPNLGMSAAITSLRRCIEEYGFYGIKLNGAQNEFQIDDPKLSLPLIEMIARLGSRLALHIGADSYINTNPSRLAKIAGLFPDLTILAIHMGGAAFHDMSSLVIEVAEAHKNIHLVGSAVRAIPILTAVKRLGPTRVSFGSDTPFELMHVEVEKYNALFKNEVSQMEFDLIMSGNIQRIFNL